MGYGASYIMENYQLYNPGIGFSWYNAPYCAYCYTSEWWYHQMFVPWLEELCQPFPTRVLGKARTPTSVLGYPILGGFEYWTRLPWNPCGSIRPDINSHLILLVRRIWLRVFYPSDLSDFMCMYVYYIQQLQHWLVVWNIFYFSIYWE